MTDTAMQLPPTERRCPRCSPGINYREGVEYCPSHGESVRPMLKRICLCGFDGSEWGHLYCIKCGKVLEGSK